MDARRNYVRFDDRGEAGPLAAHPASVAVTLDDVAQNDASQRPKPPFTTSTMQRAASSRLKLVSDTMATAQKLYEAGKITCMRSDAVMVAAEAQAAARSWLTAAFGEGAVPAELPCYEASQEAHEAIRPTDPAAGGEGIDPAHAPLYDLIRCRLLASQMTPARIRRTTWKPSAPGPSGQSVRLVAQGRVVVDPGFHRVLPPASLADEPPAVPDLAAGTVRAPGGTAPEVSSSWTKPPPRYTEASLVAELESAGVGRPSTYANTLKTLVDRRYALLDGRVFVVTPLGRLVCARLRQHFPKVTDVGFTAKLEKQLDEVASRACRHASVAGRLLREAARRAVGRRERSHVRSAEAGGHRPAVSGLRGADRGAARAQPAGAGVPHVSGPRRSWSGRPGRRGGRPRRRSRPSRRRPSRPLPTSGCSRVAVVWRGAATLEGGRRLRAPVRGVARVRGRGVSRPSAARGPGVATPVPGRRSVGVDSGGSIFASGNCGWSSGNGPCFWKNFSKCKRHHRGAFFDRQDIDTLWILSALPVDI